MEHRPVTVEDLTQAPLLSSLDDDALAGLAERMERRELESGEAVLREGEEGDRFYVVLSGLLAARQAAAGQQAVLTPGEYFGEIALVAHVHRTASVSALTAATVASCDAQTFDELLAPLFWT